jgi:hypothetical protein
MLIDLGVKVVAVTERMGHSDLSVTLREYGHLVEGLQERVREQLDDLRRRPLERRRWMVGSSNSLRSMAGRGQAAKTRFERVTGFQPRTV